MPMGFGPSACGLSHGRLIALRSGCMITGVNDAMFACVCAGGQMLSCRLHTHLASSLPPTRTNTHTPHETSYIKQKRKEPPVGIEPTTIRLRSACSTN